MSDSQSDDFSELGRRFGEAQARQLEANDSRPRVRARLLGAERTGSPRGWAWLLAPALVFGAALLFFGISAASRAPLTFALGAKPGQVGQLISAGAGAAEPLRFSDGSVLRLTATSRSRVLSVTAQGARVELERGVMEASVVHRPETAWAVLAGPFQVTVTGTKFVTHWEPLTQQLMVSVTEGSVIVSGGTLHASERVLQGETMQVQVAPRTTPLPSVSAPAETAGPGPLATAAEKAAPAPSARRPSPSSEAFRGVLEAGSPTDLVTWSEELRQRGDQSGAVRALLALRTRFPNDPRSWLAARTLSEMALGRRDCADARRWLTAYSAHAGGAATGQLSQAVEHCVGSR